MSDRVELQSIGPACIKDPWTEIPSMDPGSTRRISRRDARSTVSRRGVIHTGLALGGAVALSVLAGLPPMRPRIARAEEGTEHFHCAGYDDWDGYYDDSDPCVGAPYSSSNCGSDKWYKRASGTCFNQYPVVVCGEGYTARNAWRWTHSGTPYRCADGMIVYCGGSEFNICSAANP